MRSVTSDNPQCRSLKSRQSQRRRRSSRNGWVGGAGSSGVGYWTLDPKVQGTNPWGTGRWGLAASPSPWLWRWAVPPASGPHTYRKNSKPGQCKYNICSALIHKKKWVGRADGTQSGGRVCRRPRRLRQPHQRCNQN